MKDLEPKAPTERSAPSDRSAPIPLADRRRLVRPGDTPETPAPVFTDWASI